MSSYLIIGEGKLFSSIARYISHATMIYPVTIWDSEEWKASLGECRHPWDLYGKLERIYLIPGTTTNGIEWISSISPWLLGKLFLVTDNLKSHSLYRKMGVDYVIVTSSHYRSYSWLPTKDDGLSLFKEVDRL